VSLFVRRPERSLEEIRAGVSAERRRRRCLGQRVVDGADDRWPSSKARSEAIMSTMARAGSAPEPSSSPARTSSGGRRRPAAGHEALARLAGALELDDLERAGRHRAVRPDLHGPAGAAEDGLAHRRAQGPSAPAAKRPLRV
jgi:hypothetical protein